MSLTRIKRTIRVFRSTPLHPQWLLNRARDPARWLHQAARRSVLDIGCADRWAERVLGADCDYVGLDYPDTGSRLYSARPDVFADAASLPFAAERFDTVLLLEVLEHLREPAAALREIGRILVGGGRILMTVPFLYPVHDAPHDYQRYTRHGLERDLADAGFEAIEIIPETRSLEAAGLLLCLALSGSAARLLERSRVALVVWPLLAAVVILVNLSCLLFSRLLPSWDALTTGYRVVAVKRP